MDFLAQSQHESTHSCLVSDTIFAAHFWAEHDLCTSRRITLLLPVACTVGESNPPTLELCMSVMLIVHWRRHHPLSMWMPGQVALHLRMLETLLL